MKRAVCFMNKDGNSIIQSGLVLNLDASKSNSYPGTGTTWTDLSGYSNNGTLVNSPTFDSANGGSIVFDGTNDYVNTNYSLSNSAASISVWFNASTQTSISGSILRPIIQQGDFSEFISPEGIEITMIRSGIADEGKIRFSWGDAKTPTYFLLSANRYDDNEWYLATLSNNGTTFDIYINGNLLATKLTYTSVSTATNVQIGGNTTNSSRIFLGKISEVQIYNRALSSTEVLQNYNATKGRFGL